MILLDTNFTFHGPDRDADRRTFWTRLEDLGAVAWASETQFYLLTSFTFTGCLRFMECWKRPGDFLKVQQVVGPFCIDGDYPDVVDAVLLLAANAGIIEFYQMTPRMLSLEQRTLARQRGPHVLTAAEYYASR